MRPLPLTLLLAGTVLLLALGWQVFKQSAPAAAPSATPSDRALTQDLGGVPQGHVYTGVAEEPDDVNPLTAHSMVGKRLVLAYTHDALLTTEPRSGELRPALAVAHEMAADGGSCTFTLRSDAVFADGSPVTMDDVLFGWQLHCAGHLPLGFIADAYRRVAAAEAIDARQLRIRFADHHYASLRIVGTGWLVPQRRFFVDRVNARCEPGEDKPAIDSPRFAKLLDQIDRECGPGTGPYELRADAAGNSPWRARQDLVLWRNERSWHRREAPGTWNFLGIRVLWRDQAGGLNAALRGEVDWYAHPQIDELLATHPELARRFRRLDYDYDLLGVFRVVWNCRLPPCNDVRVRRALAMLFDIEAIRKVFNGRAEPAVAHAKPGRPEYPGSLRPPAFDPAAARRLLREAGYDPAQGKPLRLRLLALQGSEPLRRMRELFASACQQVGIELEEKARDLSALAAEKRLGNWDGLLVQQYFRPWGDPYDFLHGDGVDNEGGYRSPAVDELLQRARTEADPARRAELFRQVHTLVYEDQPAALLVHPKASLLLQQRVQGIVIGPGGLSIQHAWVAPEQQENR